MAITSVSISGDDIRVTNGDGDVFTLVPVLPDRQALVFVSVELADRTKKPEALEAAIVEAKKRGVLKP